MKIQVTQEDIDNGIPENFNLCPVAQAIKRNIKRKLGMECEVEVLPSLYDLKEAHINIYPRGFLWLKLKNLIIIDLSLEANAFANEFDKHAYVEPFEFGIEHGLP